MSIYKAIPVSDCRIQLVDNRKTKYTLDKMWELYGGDNITIMNGPFFNMSTRNPSTHTKINGTVLCKPDYGEFGIGWNTNDSPKWIKMTSLGNSQYDNYFTNTVVIPDGKKRAELTSHVDADGTKTSPRRTSRPAFGFSKDGKDFVFGVENNISLWAFQDLLYKKGWKYALIGDGGASTAYRDSRYNIKPSRTISIYVVITQMKVDSEPKGAKPMIPINAYSVKKDGTKALSANFKVKEFKCNDGTDTVFIAPSLVEVLQEARTYFKAPITITSAYRTDSYNTKVGGATYSQHKYGTAADIIVKGKDPKTVYDWFDKKLNNSGGVGLYKSFVHVDVREVKARWNET